MHAHSDDRRRSHHDVMRDIAIKRYHKQPFKLTNHLNTLAPKNGNVIYIHVPYCSKICTFCSLRRTLNQPADDYAELLIAELKAYAQLDYIKNSTFDSVYFGGGTPTMLSQDELVEILTVIKQCYQLSEHAEISLETSLFELDCVKAKAIAKAGANRISVGVQTFDSRARQLFNRRGNRQFAIERLSELIASPIDNVSIDLIYNYQAQRTEDIIDDVLLADRLGVSGFSFYSLINMKSETGLQTGNKETERLLYDALYDTAISRGFSVLENSKMIKSDRYLYIIRRLEGADTVPIGAGAGGMIGGIGLMNPIDIFDYRQSIKCFGDKMGMLATGQFLKLEKYKGYLQRCFVPHTMIQAFPALTPHIEQLVQRGQLAEEGDCFRFTKDGVYWGNNINATIVEIISKHII